MLDLGANTECDTQNLVQFAVMGAAYSRVVLDLDKPRVRLLNIGTEELKGTDQLKAAAAILRDADYLGMRFDGFTEGDRSEEHTSELQSLMRISYAVFCLTTTNDAPQLDTQYNISR